MSARPALETRVPDASAARFALVLLLLLFSPIGTLAPTAPLPLAARVIDRECRLAPADAGVACPCDAIRGDLRRAVGAPIPLDTATAADLEVLPGIGPTRARAIAEQRQRSGGFRDTAALVDVRGIGPGTVARLRPLLLEPGERDPLCEPSR